MKKILAFVIMIVSLSSFGGAYGAENVDLDVSLEAEAMESVASGASADEVFINADAYLSPNQTVEFEAVTQLKCNSIKVTSVKKQYKNGSTWVDDGYLSAPSHSASGVLYGQVVNYQGSFQSGRTYRLVYTYNADGHTITRTSNSMSF